MSKTADIEDLIFKQFGIKPGANDLTPMDYLECKTIAEKFASQESRKVVEEFKKRLQEKIAHEIYIRKGTDGFTCGEQSGLATCSQLIDDLDQTTMKV